MKPKVTILKSTLSTIAWAGMLAFVLLLIGGQNSLAYGQAAQNPSHSDGTTPVSRLVRADGTLDTHAGANGTLNMEGWQIRADAQRGPLFAPEAATNWSAFNYGANGDIATVAVIGNDVYIGGTFTQICGNAACNSGNLSIRYIAKWDGANWSSLGYGLDREVNALAVIGGALYAGGGFGSLCGNAACNSGNVVVNGIARWDGTWSGLGYGVSNSVYALAVSGNNLYVGGAFEGYCLNSGCPSPTGYVTTRDIARWNGSSWSGVGYGFPITGGYIVSLATWGTHLYAGGGFTHYCGNAACTSGHVQANRVAHWNGTTWAAMGNGVNSSVWALATADNGDVYAGGDFTAACGNLACNSGNITTQRIAKWNGSTWSPLGFGLGSGRVQTIAVDGSDVYAGGGFTRTCINSACSGSGPLVRQVAKWDGAAWSALTFGVSSGNVTSLVINNSGEVHVGGFFLDVCGNSSCNSENLDANRIAKYTPVPPPTTYSDPTSGCGGNRPCYTSLQKAINRVAVGGTVNYYPGTYSEAVNLNKSATVSFAGGSDVAINGGFTIITGTFNAPATNLMLMGDFSLAGGTFNHYGGVVTFAGPGTQNLTANAPITFNNVIVNSGAMVSETVDANNISVAGTLANSGIVQKSRLIGATGVYTFGLASGPVNGALLSMDVTTDNFSRFTVHFVGSQHPYATGTSETNGVGFSRYWTLTPDGNGTVNLTLPTNFVPADGTQVCRYLGTSFNWECAMSTYDPVAKTVTRQGISNFSDWAVGHAGPTAISRPSVTVQSVSGLPPFLFLGLVMLFLTGAGLAYRRRV